MDNDLRKVNQNDFIWTIKSGWIMVTSVNHSEYPIYVHGDGTYTYEGKEFHSNKYPSAFVEPPKELSSEPKPKYTQFKKGQRVNYVEGPNYVWKRGYYSHVDSDGNMHVFANGTDEWTSNGETQMVTEIIQVHRK